MQDLLLNCTALMIVLEFDELCFESLGSRKGRLLIAGMKPLQRKEPYSKGGLNGGPPVLVCLLFALLIATSYFNAQQGENLQAVRDELCGGNKNFLIDTDQAGAVFAGNSREMPDVESTYHYQAIRELILDSDGLKASSSLGAKSLSATVSGINGGTQSLKTVSNLNVNEAMDLWNSGCKDMFPITSTKVTFKFHFLHILRDETRNSSIKDCAGVSNYCSRDSKEGVRARQMCPEACGCNDANSALVLGGLSGCPPSCARTDKYLTSMSSRNCTDYNVSSDYWAKFAWGLRNLASSYPPPWIKDFGKTIATLSAEGCGVVSKNINMTLAAFPWNPCELSAIFVQPLTYVCPISCKCKENSQYRCPDKCSI